MAANQFKRTGRRLAVLALLAIGLACSGGSGSDYEAPAQGYDARLSGYEYPFAVQIHRFEAQRQNLEMAYMDVRPESGASNGKTALLLHGKSFSGVYWERTMEALLAEGYRVIKPDQIGFGKSSKPETFQFSFHSLAGHTRDLLDALEVEAAAVIGHSMGGMLATRFAPRFPERTSKLALVNPIGLSFRAATLCTGKICAAPRKTDCARGGMRCAGAWLASCRKSR